jgi:hypothetical protein
MTNRDQVERSVLGGQSEDLQDLSIVERPNGYGTQIQGHSLQK